MHYSKFILPQQCQNLVLEAIWDISCCKKEINIRSKSEWPADMRPAISIANALSTSVASLWLTTNAIMIRIIIIIKTTNSQQKKNDCNLRARHT